MNCIIIGLTVFLSAGECRVRAQGNFAPIVLRTGAKQPIVSSQIILSPAGQNAFISLEFGFSTDEVFGPGRIFDSFTVSVGRSGSMEVRTLATLDAGGAFLAPVSLGGNKGDLPTTVRDVTSFPSISPAYAAKSGYVLSAPVGAELSDSPVTVYFDLFDNLDSEPSLGYFRLVSMVPEPPAWALFSVGFLLLPWVRRVFRA